MMIEVGDLTLPIVYRNYSCGTAPDFRLFFTGHRLRLIKQAWLSYPSGGEGNLNHISIWLLRYTDYIIFRINL